MEILKEKEIAGTAFSGCDFALRFPEDRKSIRILQLTDMQIIDATQRRTPGRLRPDEVAAWDPQNFDSQCGDHIRSLVAQARPDLIIITGDLVYGSFDDNGRTLCYLCDLLDSFGIPFAPVFGNHDNESAMGVRWQCERLLKSRFCLFRRGEVSGNGNYTVGIAKGERLIRVLHMLDSNGCRAATDPAVIREGGLYPDQLALVASATERIRLSQKRAVPAFMAFHLPVDVYREAERAKGYTKDGETPYAIGIDVPAKDGDFGFSAGAYPTLRTEAGFVDFLHAQGVEAVFAGHVHTNSFCITYRDIVWAFGLKTGQYDYHLPYQLGGTLITLHEDEFEISHLPALVRCASFPGKCEIFEGLLTFGE